MRISREPVSAAAVADAVRPMAMRDFRNPLQILNKADNSPRRVSQLRASRAGALRSRARDRGLQPHGYLPPAQIVTAACGVITDWSGLSPVLQSGGDDLAATPPELHAQMLSLKLVEHEAMDDV